MKDYIFTIFLVLCIIIVIIGIVGIFIYFEEDSASNISNETYQTNEVLKPEETDNTVENEVINEEIDEENQRENIEENSDTEVEEENDLDPEEEEEPILNQIVNKFNNSNTTREMIMRGYPMRASASENQIIITTGTTGLTIQQEFYLDNNILSTAVDKYEEQSEIAAMKLLLASTLFDCVAQLKGHQPKALTNKLLGEDFLDFTIENEGVQFIDGDVITMKIDINGEFSFLNN